MSENTYEQLVSKVKGIDYIVGPGMKFILQDSIKKTHKSDLEKMCGCAEGLGISCEDYNLSLLADFLYNLDKQVSQNVVIGHGDQNALALYFKDKDKFLKSKNNAAVEYIATDKSGKKYITLTEKGVVLFRDIWNSGREVCYNDHMVPFSKLESDGFNLTKETVDVTKDGAPVFEDQATLVKNTTGPSILVQNRLGSAGLTDEYLASDESIVGSRKPIRGSYRSQKF